MFPRSLLVLASALSIAVAQNSSTCQATTQHLSDPPYENYFYSDCHVDAQAVVTSPLADSNLTIIGPRLIIAWPAGNSGVCTFFQPQDGNNGSLAIALVNSTLGEPLAPVYTVSNSSGNPVVGVQGVMSFNSSAELTIAILGSVRSIRDFTEGPSLLQPVIQNAVKVSQVNKTGASFSRLWLDNITTTTFTLVPYENSETTIQVNQKNKSISFGAGFYTFSASFNYPQLTQLPASSVLNNQSQALITQFPSQSTSLSFLSYTEKLLAGAWRFLTYFGRDSMISALLLEPVLSTGNGSAMEAVLAAVLERINRTDGSVCHEETIGDYATYLNLQENITSTEAGFTYPMVDTDLYLPILMSRYFSTYPHRVAPLLARKAGAVDLTNRNLTYANLTLINARKIMSMTAAFAAPHNQTQANLIHLKSDQIVGQWRDSTYGLGGGRIPFDVNCALVPAALRAISILASIPGVYPNTSSNGVNYTTWTRLASSRADIWENSTLGFFQKSIDRSTASNRLQTFTDTSTFYKGPTQSGSLVNGSDADGNLTLYSLALDGYDELSSVDALHTDTAFHLFLLNSTTSSSSPAFNTQYLNLLNSTASSILRPFPAGLLTPQGLVVANPALSGSAVLNANFTNSAYHGTVVWSWQLAMMAKGLEIQLGRCSNSSNTTKSAMPKFCSDKPTITNLRNAYHLLWDTLESPTVAAQLQSEVWSWTYDADTKAYTTTPLGSLPPPPGVSAGTESDVRQLWSLTFLAVTRKMGL